MDDAPKSHTDREYEDELNRLREAVLLMGAKVEEMIAAGLRTLVERDAARAEKIIASDEAVDRLEMEIDDMCMHILALRQPVASDLRMITMALKVVTDLERIGDLAVNLAERSRELAAEPPLKPYVGLVHMGGEVAQMVHQALDAFVAKDASRAAAVIRQDETIDEDYLQVFRALLTYMMEDPRTIHGAIKLQAVAKYLERIGDHACNLAEMVIFQVQGRDVRHGGRGAAPTSPPTAG